MKFANIRIGRRLSAGFGLVLMLTVSLISVGLLHLSEIGAMSANMIDSEWVKADAASTIDAMTRANARRTMELIIAPDTAYANRVRDRIKSNKQAIDAALATLDGLVYRSEGKVLLAKTKELRMQYVGSFNKVDQLIAANDHDGASKLLIAETLPALDALQLSIRELTTLQKKIVGSSGTEIKRIIASSRNWMMGLGLASVLIGIGFAYAITRSITRPINQAVRVAQTVAGGNLTSQITVASTDETGQLMQALKEMNDALLQIVSQVRSGTDTIATATSQIAAGNLDLSSRTEQQAGTLEETASSMEELTATVKQNAENAQQANRLAVSASGVAMRGGQVVSQVVETMSSINASSRQIVDIISVIDGIAFQTNILALNAAVEAARAGDQGRGFAVVAAEVRNLAQRSAAAAKEIKTLINSSVEQVDAGASLVNQAGLTMNEIVASVQLVTNIMAEITAAGQEQSAGIEQINEAITQMDEVTQQNAALVEEAAAAAGALQDRASHLSEVVSVFQLDAAHTAEVLPLSTSSRPAGTAQRVAATRQLAVVDDQPARRAANARAPSQSDWEEF
jgi:methyl-accepting chemotaxis protein